MKLKTLLSSIIISTATITLLSCADNHNTNTHQIPNVNEFSISRRFNLITPQSTPTVQVFNSANLPVANAQVLVGSAVNTPFSDNFKITDSNGLVTFDTWTDAAHVTVNAEGYIRQTLLNQQPGTLQIKLNTAYLAPRPLIKGQVTGLPVKDGDKMMDFSLVLPTIAKSDLMSLDLDAIISPYSDTVDIIFGKKAELPSNVSLPTQKEKYNFLISLTLSKPEYRAYATTYGPKTYYALSGRFPFKEVVDELQAEKKFYEVLNHFQFNSGGLREATITGPATTLNIPGTEIKFDGANLIVKGTQVQSDEVVLSMSMSDVSNGKFVPTDVKRVNPNETVQLKSMANKPSYIVNLLKKANDFDPATQDPSSRSSASMLPYKSGATQSLLPLLPSGPTVTNADGFYKVIIPLASNKTLDDQIINPLAVTVTISNINTVQDGQYQVEMLDRKWEVLGTIWPAEINLPLWPLDETNSASVKRKFEVNLIGSQESVKTDLGEDLIKAATHVTKGAAEL